MPSPPTNKIELTGFATSLDDDVELRQLNAADSRAWEDWNS